jgi:hypothetical protein
LVGRDVKFVPISVAKDEMAVGGDGFERGILYRSAYCDEFRRRNISVPRGRETAETNANNDGEHPAKRELAD